MCFVTELSLNNVCFYESTRQLWPLRLTPEEWGIVWVVCSGDGRRLCIRVALIKVLLCFEELC